MSLLAEAYYYNIVSKRNRKRNETRIFMSLRGAVYLSSEEKQRERERAQTKRTEREGTRREMEKHERRGREGE